MKIQLTNTEETLDLGITGSGEFFIEFFEQKLAIRVEPSKIVPDKWHKIVITKQHQKLTLKVDAHQETLHLDSGWPKLSFSDEPLLFTGTYETYFYFTNVHGIPSLSAKSNFDVMLRKIGQIFKVKVFS